MNRPRWRRKWETDVVTDGWSPVPTQVVSNEEYLPLRRTPAPEQVARRLWEISRAHAGTLGMVFGRFFEVDPVEAWEASAAAERQPQGQFVFDIQTHHVAAPRSFTPVLGFRAMARRWDPSIWSEGRMEEVYLQNYIKEIFLDSDASVAVLSGVAAVSDAVNFMPPDKIAETREVVNRLVASRRVLTHGLLSPTQGRQNLENMERQVAELKVSAWGVPHPRLGRWTTRRSPTRCIRLPAGSGSGTSVSTRACPSPARWRTTGTLVTSRRPRATSPI